MRATCGLCLAVVCYETLLIFTSDQAHRFCTATVYDGGTQVPWLMRRPGGIPANTRVSSLTSHVDILPTLLDLPGLSIRAYGRPGMYRRSAR